MQEHNNELTSHLMAADLSASELSHEERELLMFVELVTRHAYKTTDQDVQKLREVGWSDPQIAECVYITALFAFFNRVADAFGLEDPNYFDAGAPPAGSMIANQDDLPTAERGEVS